MTKIGTQVDPKVYDLASHFLKEVEGATDEDKRFLAEEIQGLVEEFVDDLNGFAKSERAVTEIPSPL